MRFRLISVVSIFSVIAGASLNSPLHADEEAPEKTVVDSQGAVEEKGATEKAAAEVKKYDLEYKFTLGQVVRLMTTYRAKMDVSYRESKQTDTNSSKLWKHYTVTSVAEDGAGTLRLQIDKAHLTARFGDTSPVVFKSDDPDFHPAKFQNMLAQIGKVTAHVEYTTRGKLRKVIKPSGKPQVATGNRPPADHQGFMIPLPEEPVAIGDQWKDRFKQNVAVEGGLSRDIDMMRTYRLKSVEGNLAKISFTTAILTPVNNGKILGQLIQKQTVGTVTLDLEKKQIVEKIVTVNKTVINPFGQGSLMRAVTSFAEKLQPAETVAENMGQQADAAASKN